MFWWSWSLAADPVNPVRQCAEAAEGTEIEVCTRLAATHPEQVYGIVAALAAHMDRRSGPDRELMNALLLLEDADTGAEGASALGALGDTRAIAALVHTATTREPEVASAAVEALARYPEGLGWLRRWLVDKQLPLEVRIQAANVLGDVHDIRAGDALVDSLRHRGLPSSLRRAMLDAIATGHPHRQDELVDAISRDGTVWLTVTGATALGYAIGVAGRAEPEVAVTGATAGTIAGGTLGYLIGQAVPTEAGDAAFIGANTMVGGAAGLTLAAGLKRDDAELAGWSGVAGEAAGLGLGIALHKAHRGEPEDSLEAAAMGVAMAGALGGALELGARNGLSDPERSNTRPPLVGVGLGLIGGTALGHVIAPNIRLQRNDWGLVALATGAGAAIGALAPLAGNERSGLPVVGAAVGSLSGFALAGAIDPDWDALASGTVGAVFGGAALGGVVMWVKPEDRPLTRGAILLGGIAGLGAGGLLADRDQDPVDDRDVVLSVYTTGWTTAHVIGLNLQADGDALQPLGPLLALPCVVGGLTAGLSSELDIPVTHSSAAVSTGLVGATLGGTIGELAFGEPVLGAMVGGDAALVGGIVVLSPLVGTPPTTLALANTGGVLGGGTGLAVARLVDRRTDTLLAGSVIGAGVGYVGGAVTGHVLRRRGAARNIALRLPRLDVDWSLAPTALPVRDDIAYGAVLQVHGW